MEDDPSVVPKMTLDSVGNIASAAWNEQQWSFVIVEINNKAIDE